MKFPNTFLTLTLSLAFFAVSIAAQSNEGTMVLSVRDTATHTREARSRPAADRHSIPTILVRNIHPDRATAYIASAATCITLSLPRSKSAETFRSIRAHDLTSRPGEIQTATDITLNDRHSPPIQTNRASYQLRTDCSIQTHGLATDLFRAISDAVAN